MSIYPSKFVKLIHKKTGSTYIYEVCQVIYGEFILGVACITDNGIEDFYFSEYRMVPIGGDKQNYDFRYKK
jgi:hypothetical protein